MIRFGIAASNSRLAITCYLSKMRFMFKTTHLPDILLCVMLWLAGCTPDASVAAETFSAPTRTLEVTLVPSLERVFQPLNTIQPTPTAGEPLSQCRIDRVPSITHYTIDATISYAHRTVLVQQSIIYVNRTPNPLQAVVLNVKSNEQPGVFSLNAVKVDGAQLDQGTYDLSGQQLRVNLPENLASGCATEMMLSFRLTLPQIEDKGIRAFQGHFGYTARQLNLGHWLPVVAVYDGQAWISHESNFIGEQEVLESADWDVTVTVTDAPEDLRLVAPGTVIEEDSGHGQYSLKGARDFSLTLGSGYRVKEHKTESGVTVELYSFDDAFIQTDSGAIDSAAFALDVAAESLSTYEHLYGPYPYERMVVVQADFPDGMEFSGLVFVSGDFFRRFGGASSFLTLITAHEVAHQWWYNQVGNDQALNPWLDEALATYSEYLFLESYFPDLKNWWWEFRVDRLSPEGFVDSSVYEFSSRREYINAIYLRGGRMLHDLRLALRDEVFFDWLRRYAEAGKNSIMTPEQFWSLLTLEQYNSIAAIRERYLRNTQIIRIGTDSS